MKIIKATTLKSLKIVSERFSRSLSGTQGQADFGTQLMTAAGSHSVCRHIENLFLFHPNGENILKVHFRPRCSYDRPCGQGEVDQQHSR